MFVKKVKSVLRSSHENNLNFQSKGATNNQWRPPNATCPVYHHSTSSRGGDRHNYAADYEPDIINSNHGYRPRRSLDYPNDDDYYMNGKERRHYNIQEDPIHVRDYRHSDSGHPSSSSVSLLLIKQLVLRCSFFNGKDSLFYMHVITV